DRAHAAERVGRAAGRRAAAARRGRAPPRLRALHPRAAGGLGRARRRHAARGGRVPFFGGALRRGDRGADPAARRGQALPLRGRACVLRAALAGVGAEPRAAGRSLRRRRGGRVRGLGVRAGRGAPAALRRRRQGAGARDAGPRGLPGRAGSRLEELAPLPAEALALALAAAVIHAVWNLLLAGARDSEATAAVALPFSAHQVLGVLLVTGGVFLVRGLRRGHGVAWGLAIACCIAAYTVVDKHGVAHASPLPYLELITALTGTAYCCGLVAARGPAVVRAAIGWRSVVAGLATFAAYGLVLAALQLASAASVAAVRETSVLVAAALAAVVLKERVTRWRFLGAALVAGGVALLSLS